MEPRPQHGHGDRRAAARRRDRHPPDARRRVRPAGALRPTSSASPRAGSRLIQRGTCNYGVKVLNAQAAGASGVVIFNEGNPDRTDVIDGSLLDANNNPILPKIPVAFTSFAIGKHLYDQYNNAVQNHTALAAAHARHPVDQQAEGRRLQRDRRIRGRRSQPRRRRRRAPGRDLRRGHARQRLRFGDDPRHRPHDAQGAHPQQAAVHLVRRRGTGAAGLAELRQQARARARWARSHTTSTPT